MATFTYSAFGKALQKRRKTIKDQGKKQGFKSLKTEENKGYIKSIEGVVLKDIRTNEIKNEIDEINKLEEEIKQKDLKYETKNTQMTFSNMKQ